MWMSRINSSSTALTLSTESVDALVPKHESMRLVSVERLLPNKTWNTKQEITAAAAHATVQVPAKLDRVQKFYKSAGRFVQFSAPCPKCNSACRLNAGLGMSRTHLERTQVCPRQLPGQQLPQDQAKGVDISSCAVGLVCDHLGRQPSRIVG